MFSEWGSCGNDYEKKTQKSIVYCAEVRIKGHPSLSQTFDRQFEAMRWAEETEAALRTDGYIGNAPPDDMLFDDALEKYLAEVSSKKAKSTHLRELYQSRSLHYFFGKTLQEIPPALAAKSGKEINIPLGLNDHHRVLFQISCSRLCSISRIFLTPVLPRNTVVTSHP